MAGRWGTGGPFESGRLPRVCIGRTSFPEAYEEVPEKNDLSGHQKDRRIGDESLQRDELLDVGRRFTQFRVTAGMAGESQEMHRNKRGVGADEAEPEVNAAERFIHHAAEDLGIPEINACKDGEDRSHAHDQVEVGDDEVCVVQVSVEFGLRENRSAQSAGHEKRYKAERE